MPPASGPGAAAGAADVALLLLATPTGAGAGAALIGVTSTTADLTTGRATFAGVGLAVAAAGYGLTLRSGALRDASLVLDASGPGVAVALSPARPLLCSGSTCGAGNPPSFFYLHLLAT